MEEKRRSPRIFAAFAVTCRQEKAPWAKASGKTFNISPYGIGLKMKKSFDSNEELLVTIKRSFWSEAVTVKGKIVWQMDMAGPYGGLAGIQFTGDSWEKIDALINSI